jgi:hypothetical protein
MMYMTLSVMAGLIAVMFVTTAVSSIIASIRETDGLSKRPPAAWRSKVYDLPERGFPLPPPCSRAI